VDSRGCQKRDSPLILFRSIEEEKGDKETVAEIQRLSEDVAGTIASSPEFVAEQLEDTGTPAEGGTGMWDSLKFGGSMKLKKSKKKAKELLETLKSSNS